jgi:hypothetical protein
MDEERAGFTADGELQYQHPNPAAPSRWAKE